ncbi:DUF6230 family protein [Sphaerisporangium sp. NPDC005289]|uniref:DUF6230 family protein n=1 Tax=Sphaerisporangium sp. NPDC005289 TaxID=3155247 RepID=UPI0033A476B1
MREQGRVRWKRFAMIFIPATAAAAMLVGATVQGAVGASFVVAGTPIKSSADLVKAFGDEEFGGFVETKDGQKIPVYIVASGRLETFNLCQSYLLNTPIGPVTVRTTAGNDGRPVVAIRQVLKATMISGDVTYTGIELGRDASTLDQIPGITGPPGTPGVQAPKVVSRNSRQVFLALSAARLELPNLTLRILLGDHECF